MTTHNADNERIKRRYFAYLKEAKRHSEPTVDSVTRVPMEYVKDGQIVLNIGPVAVERFKIGNDLIEFSARFNGAGREISIPVGAVSAIYARENGQGLSFEVTAADAPASAQIAEADQSNEPPPDPPRPSGKPSLRRVK